MLVGERAGGRAAKRKGEGMDTDGRTDAGAVKHRRTDSRTRVRTDADARTNGRTDGQTHGRTDVQTHGRTDGRTDARTHGRTDGWAGGNRHMDGHSAG